MRSISSSVILSAVRSYSFVVFGDEWPAIRCACSSVPPFDRYAVMPVARNVWQPPPQRDRSAGPLPGDAPGASPRDGGPVAGPGNRVHLQPPMMTITDLADRLRRMGQPKPRRPD